MHSPFVFNFILNVLNNSNNYVAPREIETLRAQLISDNKMISVEDLGAGSRRGQQNKRRISEVARSALKPSKYAQVLFRLARHYQPKTIVELGTSLGITTSYFSRAVPEAKVITIEGSKDIAKIARENLSRLDCNNVQIIPGNFDEQLQIVLPGLPLLDLFYVDGNHRYEPTLKYFQQGLQYIANDSIMVFDDIHWSNEMEKAWDRIRAHPSVLCSIDIFFLGFVFFRREFKTKQDFQIRF